VEDFRREGASREIHFNKLTPPINTIWKRNKKTFEKAHLEKNITNNESYFGVSV